MIVKSYAKINLSLIVKSKREDGFHELDMLIQNVDLYDIITISKNEGQIRLTSDVNELPLGETNLVYQAARRMREELSLSYGFDIHIEKKIPIAAGLGGGSSNAAAVMKAIIALCGAKLEQPKLDRMALELGTEVVYFMRGGLCRVRGKGELVERLNYTDHHKYLLINPGIGLSTKEVYSALKVEDYRPEASNDAMLKSMREGGSYLDYMINDMERAAIAKMPLINEIKTELRTLGFEKVMMSGSGPTVFGVIEEGAQVDEVLSYASENKFSAFVCSAVKGE